MLNTRIITRLKPSSNGISFRRNIVVVKKNRRNVKQESSPNYSNDETPLLAWAREDTNRRIRLQESDYRKKLQEIKNLTKSVASMIKKKDELKAKELKRKEEAEAINSIQMPSEYLDKDMENIYKEISSPESAGGITASSSSSSSSCSSSQEYSKSNVSQVSHLILPSDLVLPQPIVDKLGLSIKYLISPKTQNWGMVLHQLGEVGGFKDLKPKQVYKFVQCIPSHYFKAQPGLISTIEKMMTEADIAKTSKFVDIFIEGLSSGSEVSNDAMKKIEGYYHYLKTVNKKGKISRKTFELLIAALGKNNNLEKINQYLAEMKLNKLQPSKETFSNILTCCVYKAKDHKQAVEIFDSMKFLSQGTRPTTRNYQDIIVSYINNDNIEKSLDLYQEMLIEKVEINQKILVALARGCTRRPELKMKSWEFMFEIYNLGWEPTFETYEYILYLAANDGDISLARALYKKLNETKSVTPKAFSFLMLAYSKGNPGTSSELPTIVFHEKGRIFRSRLLNDTDMETNNGDIHSPQFNIPMLPIIELRNNQEILAESSALWAHSLMFNPWLINNESTDIYLKVALEHGTLEEFKARYENSTVLDEDGIPQTREIQIEEPEIDLNDDSTLNNSKKSLTSPILESIIQSNNNKKVPRSSLIYITALRAAGKFQSYDFGQMIWDERGSFRKSTRFTTLPRLQKDQEDFKFASAMVSALTKMGMISDALAIVVSTEYQFRWSRNELSELFHTALEVGDEHTVQTVKSITSRSLINWEGKIKKRDYKKYVMERGY